MSATQNSLDNLTQSVIILQNERWVIEFEVGGMAADLIDDVIMAANTRIGQLQQQLTVERNASERG